MPAAGSTAIGSCRLRPIFCRPWNRPDPRFFSGAAVGAVAVLIDFLHRVVVYTTQWCRPVVADEVRIKEPANPATESLRDVHEHAHDKGPPDRWSGGPTRLRCQ